MTLLLDRPPELATLRPDWLTAPGPGPLGSTVPRLWTRPLRELDKTTSLGYECIAFGAIVLGIRFDPWQAWFLVHALELLPDGGLRFRTVLLLVARQNGKTTVMQALTMWALFTGRTRLVVGTAQDLDVARESWNACRNRILADPELEEEVPRHGIKTGNGKEEITLLNGCRYKVKATTKDAARGIPGVGLLLLDELRTHEDYEPYAALANTTMAVPDALIVGMSNAGNAQSIVLNELRELALSGEDPTLGIFEWSSGSVLAGTEAEVDPDCRAGWAQANPSLGYGRLTVRALESARAKATKSLKAMSVFIVENLCRWVESMDSAYDPVAWRGSVSLANVADYREHRWHGGLDVSLDGGSVVLVIATDEDRPGPVRVWTARAWPSVEDARRELPGVLKSLGLRRLAWCPGGPAAELGAVVRAAGRRKGSLYGTELVELAGTSLAEATMGLATSIRGRQVIHQDEEILNAQVVSCAKLWQGDRWVLTRRGAGHANAAYALAFAVHATMTAPARRRAEPLEDESADEAPEDPEAPPY